MLTEAPSVLRNSWNFLLSFIRSLCASFSFLHFLLFSRLLWFYVCICVAGSCLALRQFSFICTWLFLFILASVCARVYKRIRWNGKGKREPKRRRFSMAKSGKMQNKKKKRKQCETERKNVQMYKESMQFFFSFLHLFLFIFLFNGRTIATETRWIDVENERSEGEEMKTVHEECGTQWTMKYQKKNERAKNIREILVSLQCSSPSERNKKQFMFSEKKKKKNNSRFVFFTHFHFQRFFFVCLLGLFDHVVGRTASHSRIHCDLMERTKNERGKKVFIRMFIFQNVCKCTNSSDSTSSSFFFSSSFRLVFYKSETYFNTHTHTPRKKYL